LDRVGFPGYDLFTPIESLETVFEKLAAAGRTLGGREVGFTAFETARFEAGIPRFGIEMDETHLPPETGLEKDAISYTKGCYTGQETIARLRTYGQVVKALRGLQLHPPGGELPKRGDKIVREGKVVGQVVSALRSPAFGTDLALGYVRKECNAVGTSLVVQTASGEVSATIVALPFAQQL
jgi:aminomethyltransferase